MGRNDSILLPFRVGSGIGDFCVWVRERDVVWKSGSRGSASGRAFLVRMIKCTTRGRFLSVVQLDGGFCLRDE